MKKEEEAKRYEFDVLCRFVIKAYSREAAQLIYESQKELMYRWVVGEPIVQETEWWQLPGEKVLAGPTAALPWKLENAEVKLKPRSKSRRKLQLKSQLEMSQLVNRLKNLYQHGTSAASIARALKVSPASVYGWLQGRWKPSESMKTPIEEYLAKAEEEKDKKPKKNE